MAIQLQRAGSTHARDIAMIGHQSFKGAFEDIFINRDELRDYLTYAYDTGKILRSIGKNNNAYFIAFVDGLPAGFAKVKRHSLNDNIDSGAQMELQKIYVLFEYHGKGVADALMKMVVDFASDEGRDILWLDVHLTNLRAIRFYEKSGFQRVGSHHFTIGTQQFQFHVMGLPITVNA